MRHSAPILYCKSMPGSHFLSLSCLVEHQSREDVFVVLDAEKDWRFINNVGPVNPVVDCWH